MRVGTNIFPILNAGQITSRYSMYRIRGLKNAPDEYYANCQHIIRRLSFSLHSPITIIHQNDEPYLIAQDSARIPDGISVVRTAVRFDKADTLNLDYTARSPENDAICQRFLDFAVQGLLFNRNELWQPGAGRPFFEKNGIPIRHNLILYQGYAVRSTISPNGQLGFCVDLTSKVVSRDPLSHHISQDEFEQWKNRTFVYHYGHRWYEIKLTALSDLHASEYLIPGTDQTVLQWVTESCQKPIPKELASIPHDAAVGIYLNNQEQTRGAPISLCYPVIRNNDAEARDYHQHSIKPPHIRRRESIGFVKNYLRNIPFGATPIQVSSDPVEVESRMFIVPDVEFGHSQVLSIRGTPSAQHTSLDALGKDRMGLLRDQTAGFYIQDPLDRHYLILPQSVADSYGNRFISDLKQKTRDLYPHPYEPEVVTYNDRVPRTFPKQGNSILQAVREKCTMSGFAVVMIHHTVDRQERQEDQLAAMIMRELRKEEIDVKAAVIHASVGRECYQEITQNGQPEYVPDPRKHGKLNGYLRMVAINKILLNNEKWPFVLNTRLHADLTIGMDIKGNTVGFVVVGAHGGEINTLFKTSRRKEKLTREQMKAYLVAIIRQEAEIRDEPIQNIVIQRDGRLFDLERDGIHDAMDFLKNEGVLPTLSSITLVEISKSAPVRLRLYSISERDERPWIENPQVGTYCILNDTEGFLCSTGRAFPKQGTVRPLHIRRLEGPLTLEQCLEDVFFLTCLPWTRPDDAIRNPITIKLIDRFLAEEATDYDDDALDIDAILDELDELDLEEESTP